MLIECDTCEMRDIACDDCVVAVLLHTPPAQTHWAAAAVPPVPGGGRAELTGDERAAIAVLAGSGLVPPLQLVAGEPRPETA